MADLDCVRAASREKRSTESTSVPAMFTAPEGRAWISRQLQRSFDSQGWSLAITEACSGRSVGCIVLLHRPQPGVTGIGYWLIPEARRRSYAARAVDLVTSWALGTGRLARVEAWVEPDNDPSIAVLDRCGFECEERLRSFLALKSRRTDALVFSRVAATLLPQRS
jgi:[ribosomal protein S5]-alanine N-acetyltransferase